MKLVKRGLKTYLVYEEQGPDTRYRKRAFRIPIEEIESYIDAYRENFSLYLQKKEKDQVGTFQGKKKMKIRVGGLYEGVCLFEHYQPVRTREQLEQRIAELKSYLLG